MPALSKLLRNLDPADVNQWVKLRLIRTYTLQVGDDINDVYSIECVLHDAEGHRIHASIRKPFFSRYQAILKEERLFDIKNFMLCTNNITLKTSIAEYKIVFTRKTTVNEVYDDDYPRHIFDFKVYDDLALWENMNESVLIDVIGRLSSRSTMQYRELRGRQTAILNINLQNLQGNVIPCTLLGDYAEELFNHAEANEGSVVIIMQMCRIRKLRGEVQLLNAFNASRVISDENVQEIEDFNHGLVLESNGNTPMPNFFNPSSVTISEELAMSRNPILSVDRLIRVHKIDHFWVFGQVVAIEPMIGWYIVSCKNCSKKMAKAGQYFYCVFCDISDPVGKLSYKVLVRVADNWGIAALILGDNDCFKLIGQTAAELEATTVGEGVPKAISRIVGLKALFKVDIKDFSSDVNLGPFPVLKLTSDVQVISRFYDMNSISNVIGQEQVADEPDFAPARPMMVRTVPAIVRVGVKRNLMGEFSGIQDVGDGKAGLEDGKSAIKEE